MSTFNQRWDRLVASARRAPTPPLPSAPGHQVGAWMRAARARGFGAAARGGPSSGDLWLSYGLRGLATAALVLLVSVWFAFGGRRGEREGTPLRPGIENAVAEVFWLL